MLVWIVVAALPDNSGMDVDRMNRVEDLEPEIARAMMNAGTAREATEAEIAAYRGENPDAEDPDAPVDGPKPVADEPYEAVPAEQSAVEPERAESAENATRPRKGAGDMPLTTGTNRPIEH